MKLISEKAPLDTFKAASKVLYDAVAHTLGPSGSNTAVVYGKDVQANPKFQIINDGKTIIDNLTSPDAEVACALQTIRESVLSTNNVAGDGTTSTIIMIYSLLEELSKLDISSFEMCRQLNNLKKDILQILPSQSIKLNEEINIRKIAETSLGSDEYVELFERAYQFIGNNGEVLLEKSTNPSPCLEEIDGISLNQVGFIPEMVLDDTGEIKATLPPCQTIIFKDDITSFSTISNLILKSKASNEPILLFYPRMSTDVFRLMVSNLMKGGYNIYPVSLEGYGEKVPRYLQLMATITGGRVIDNNEKIDINNNEIYGKLAGAIFNKEALVLKPIDSLLETITKYINDNKFNIATKTAVIKAGAMNSIVLEEQYRRFEDAIHSCTNALKAGVCYGGGLTYIKIGEHLYDKEAFASDEMAEAFTGALASIYEHLLANCGLDNGAYNIGTKRYVLPRLDESTGQYSLDYNYMIYDSYTTVEQVLCNSIDMVRSIFSTKILICDPQR